MREAFIEQLKDMMKYTGIALLAVVAYCALWLGLEWIASLVIGEPWSVIVATAIGLACYMTAVAYFLARQATR